MSGSRPHERVVVTGIGLVTPFGLSREQSWNGFREGASATRWLHADELGGPAASSPRAERWPSFAGAAAPRGRIEPAIVGGVEYAEPVVTLAARAAAEALSDAGLDVDSEDRTRFGCVVGTSKGGLEGLSRAFAGRIGDAPPQANVWQQLLPCLPSSVVAGVHRLQGPCLCPVAACATGLLSLNRGFELIRDGHCDLVLAGSSDASLRTAVLSSFRRMGVLARGFDDPASACRPFDRRRSGFLVGEGAAMLVMERLDRAAARGVRPYAEWIAAGYAADVSGITSLEDPPRGLVRLIRDVLRRSGLTSEEIDYVNLHGTATRQNDVCETNALKAACGPAARGLCCSSLKGGAGHMLGAAGSAETAATLLAMRHGIVPPTVNLSEPDGQCDLDYTPAIARPRRIENALKLSLGFGGHLVAAVMREWTS